MNILSYLKIGIKLAILIAIISIVGIWGMVKINNESNKVETNLNDIINNNIKRQSILTDAERYINKGNHQLIQGINLYNNTSQSVINQKVTLASKNFELAKNQMKLYQQSLSKDDKISFSNANALFVNFNNFIDISKVMVNYVSSADSLLVIDEFYRNKYYPAFKNFEVSLGRHLNEFDEILANSYNNSKKVLTKTKTNSFIVLFIIIILLIITGFVLDRSITRPIKMLSGYISKLSKGELPENLTVDSKDEIGEIKTIINSLLAGLRKTANFGKQIGEGNLNVEYTPLSNKDILGNSLLEMRKGLQAAKEEENKRKEEDDKRNWATQGLAKFGDILRKDNDDLEKLSNDIMSNLIDYVNANQGGLFIFNDDEEDNVHLELIASYAFSRKKFNAKKIQLGEGLVGTCAIEKETIYMTEVPEDYVEVTSGLGDSNPRSLLIVPLKLEEKIFGIIELASFNNFEDYQIEFVEKIGESIASTLSSVKINAKTAALLEETKLQAEEMATKEEEMRQNLEELKATQEEMERIKKRESEKTEDLMKQQEENRKMLIKILDHVPEKVFLKDKEGKMILVNSAVAKVHGISAEELIGQSDFNFFNEEKAKELYSEELDIMNTGPKTFTQTEEFGGGKKILQTTKMPFYIPYLKETGLLGVQVDITELTRLQEKEKELISEIERLKEELNK